MATIKKVISEKLPQYDLDTAWGLAYDNQGDKCTYEWQFESESEELY